MLDMLNWSNHQRPGYFGRRRDEKIAALDTTHGKGRWRLAWVVGPPPANFVTCTPWPTGSYDFEDACRSFYEHSYFERLKTRPGDIDFICSFGECIDNAPTTVLSGCDYLKQESYSTHIQDIAVRNVLRRLGRKFEGPSEKILVIRSENSNGFRFGPGNVPFALPNIIQQPSLRPKWANEGSVEDFWQSNKYVQVLQEPYPF